MECEFRLLEKYFDRSLKLTEVKLRAVETVERVLSITMLDITVCCPSQFGTLQ